MMKAKTYRKKPIVITAMCFDTNNETGSPTMDAIVDWINAGKGENDDHAWHNGTDIFIKTLEGTMSATVGDYIICGVESEFYPCKPEIFFKTYEEVK